MKAPKLLGERHRLVVWLGDTARSWPLPSSGRVEVGRAPEADVQIASPMVSRQHASLVIEPGLVSLADLGSQNGTRVNGERISSGRFLGYGDIISFGDVTGAFIPDHGEGPGARAGGDEREGGADGGGASLERSTALGDRTVLVADQVMLNVYGQLELLAPSELSVLVLGETGTGKELAARALHFWSKRRTQPLVTINCASLPEALAESELFGHERGAFSGAVQAKPGLLESAQGGTVFLDEIGDLSAAVQAKLLRVLEARRVTRLGSVQERQIDVRVVAATHRNLIEDVRSGRFREDLYYRLGAAVVRLPPLRARPQEVPLLAQAFVDQARAALGRPPLAFSEAALRALDTHGWPGNVRELKNLADYLAATVVDASITAGHVQARLESNTPVSAVVPPGVPAVVPPVLAARAPTAASASVAYVEPPTSTALSMDPKTGAAGGGRARTIDFQPLADANRRFERERIESALAETGGNKTQAARLLGVPLRTFMEKIKRHGLG